MTASTARVHLLLSASLQGNSKPSSTLGSDGETLIPQSLSGLMVNPVKLQNRLSVDIAEGNAATCVMFWSVRNQPGELTQRGKGDDLFR